MSEIDWNVRSRQSAISSPIAPPAIPEDAVTRNRLLTCANEIPPNRVQIISSPTLAPRIVSTLISPATSFPSTISRSLRSVMSSSVKVRRSFSYEMAAAVKIGAKKSISVNWSMAKIRYSKPPNRASTPTSRIVCQPMSDCQVVHIRMNNTHENDARAR